MLIFSQMSLALNIYGDLWSIVFFHPGVYGGTAHKDRIVIDEYNKPGSEQFIFLSDDACTVLAIWVSNLLQTVAEFSSIQTDIDAIIQRGPQ